MRSVRLSSARQAEIVDDAIRRHQRLGTAADPRDLIACSELFVDVNLLRRLDNPQWEIIYGRPGSGKTMLLRTLYETQRLAVEDDHEELRRAGIDLEHAGILPIYLNAGEARAVLANDMQVDDRAKAFAYFVAFMQDFAKELRRRVQALPRGGPGRRFSRRSRLLDDVDRLIEELFDVLPNDVELPVYLQTTRKTKWSSARSNRRQSASSAVAGLDVDAGPLQAKTRIGGSANIDVGTASSTTQEAEGSVAIRYGVIGDKVDAILDRLRVSRLCLLLDDWTHLDRSGRTTIQPLFGEYLKQAFGRGARVSVKIAIDRYEARLLAEDGDVIVGFRPGDLREALNLSHALLAQDHLVPYFEAILWRRMSLRSELKEVFDETRFGIPEPGFIDAMFDNRQAFQELVLGSEGNPGAFLEAFRRLVVQSSYSVDPKWDEVDVRRALAVVLNRTELYRHATPGIRVLTRAIKPVAVRNSSRKFVTRARASSGLRSALDELHEKDLISAGAERLPTELDKFYEAWEVSEDVWHEWNRAMESAHGEPADPSTGIDIASIDDFLIEDPWRKRRS